MIPAMATLSVRPLTAADIPLGMRLKSAVNWNQTEADWRRVLELDPTGSFVGQLDGVDVGTVTTVAFGSIGWIGLMLVDETVRGQGVGKALMQTALDDLERRGVKSIRLDATPLGQPLYEKLGFTADFALARWSGEPNASAPLDGVSQLATDSSVDRIAALDQQATATDRRALLAALLRDQPPVAQVIETGSQLVAAVLSRRGANATQVGPCSALESSSGAKLLRSAIGQLAGQPVYVDIPDSNSAARAIATEYGLAVQRPLLRMTRGEKIAERPELIWASFGPEKG